MHRIPLLMPTPSILWDRNLPEWLLFERTLHKPNVEETNAFLAILDSEADFYKTQCYRMAEDMFSKAQKYLSENNTKSFAEGMFYINYIILRTPKDSSILACALKIRGLISYHKCYFEVDINLTDLHTIGNVAVIIRKLKGSSSIAIECSSHNKKAKGKLVISNFV